jgi:hypothetical protein
VAADRAAGAARLQSRRARFVAPLRALLPATSPTIAISLGVGSLRGDPRPSRALVVRRVYKEADHHDRLLPSHNDPETVAQELGCRVTTVEGLWARHCLPRTKLG